MNNPQIPAGFNLTGNAAVDGLIIRILTAAAAALAAWIVAWLKARGFSDPNTQALIAGAAFSILAGIAATAYGWVLAKVNQAKAVQAGVNLSVSGQAVTTDGEKITSLGSPDASPPKPVTTASAAEIVKQFATPNPK
jgi:hypothetical protein